MARKEKHIISAPGLEKSARRVIREVEGAIKGYDRKRHESIVLTPQEKILDQEDDLGMLRLNEKQYAAAIGVNQIGLNILRLMDSWGPNRQEWKQFSPSTDPNQIINNINQMARMGIGKDRIVLALTQVRSLQKAPRFYRDETDGLINELLRADENLSPSELYADQLRSQRETLALIRLQIDFLKEKEKRERGEKSKPKSTSVNAIGTKSDIKPDESLPTAEVSIEPVQTDKEISLEPFALSGWQVYWTDVKFSDKENHLTLLPTDSRENFSSRLEEINAGRKHFQIKTTSVATCIEMWAIPEFRQRAITSRFRWGPPEVRDWSKLPRGPVRIMVKSNEEEKRLVFFAADRDTVYRNIFAGMSS